ncbi:MAG TPA: hypothetical protein VJ867_16780, partial [Gemmatimonadaceae bacterium]|nr:hypothetical protein [Gemmatimonadaceae bacterium]
ERYDRLIGRRRPLAPRPSRATDIAHGYGSLARFFQGARDVSAAIDDRVVDRALGAANTDRDQVFEDQYISSGGQLYELMMGHDRWVADVRPLLANELRKRGRPPMLCCHPYDLCTESIARAAGVVVADVHGRRLSAPLDVTTDVAWVGFANDSLRQLVYPALRDALDERDIRV